MRNPALRALGAVALAGFAVLLIVALTDERRLAFTVGVQPLQVTNGIGRGQEACQRPILASADAELVQVKLGTYGRPGPPATVSVKSAGRVLDTARIAPGYPDSLHSLPIGGVRSGREIEVCVRNEGGRLLGLYGGPPQAARTSALFVQGKEVSADMAVVFLRDEPRSVAALVPDMLERAALFKLSWLEAWLLWALAALTLVAVPVALGIALVAATRADAETDRP